MTGLMLLYPLFQLHFEMTWEASMIISISRNKLIFKELEQIIPGYSEGTIKIALNPGVTPNDLAFVTE